MNKNLYRLVFSKKVGTLVAVAETTVSQGKSAGETTGASAASPSGAGGFGLAMMSFAVAAAVLGSQGITSSAYAQSAGLPTGGSITSGSGSISQSGNTLTVNQGSNVLGANWQSFNIGAGNTVIFN